jgi:hypothetical protein
MRVCLLICLLCAALLAQQPNAPGSSLMIEQTWTTPSYWTPQPGEQPPYVATLPLAGAGRVWIMGRPGQAWWLFASPGGAVPGAAWLPGGIVDLDLFAAGTGLFLEGVLSGTWTGCGTYPYCAQAGVGYFIAWTLPPGFAATLQAVVMDPLSPVGYTLTGAVTVQT